MFVGEFFTLLSGRLHNHYHSCRYVCASYRFLDNWTLQSAAKHVGLSIDWCCFYYFVLNSLIALLEALCARILFFSIREYRFFLSIFFPPLDLFVRKAFVSNRRISSALLNQAPVPGCRHFPCVLIIHVCLRMCDSVCAYENVLVKW